MISPLYADFNVKSPCQLKNRREGKIGTNDDDKDVVAAALDDDDDDDYEA